LRLRQRFSAPGRAGEGGGDDRRPLRRPLRTRHRGGLAEGGVRPDGDRVRPGAGPDRAADRSGPPHQADLHRGAARLLRRHPLHRHRFGLPAAPGTAAAPALHDRWRRPPAAGGRGAGGQHRRHHDPRPPRRLEGDDRPDRGGDRAKDRPDPGGRRRPLRRSGAERRRRRRGADHRRPGRGGEAGGAVRRLGRGDPRLAAGPDRLPGRDDRAAGGAARAVRLLLHRRHGAEPGCAGAGRGAAGREV
ncbi:MAG: FMN reductase, partial [uncultured Thermomicrobiales bacterium]